VQPTRAPSAKLTMPPSAAPTIRPSGLPSSQPSSQPSTEPTASHLSLALASPTYRVRNGVAFVAIDANGQAHTWGEAPHGGDSSAAQGFLRAKIAAVVASRFVIAAVKANGTAAAWGVPTSFTGLAPTASTTM
jgi:hypothetical protein